MQTTCFDEFPLNMFSFIRLIPQKLMQEIKPPSNYSQFFVSSGVYLLIIVSRGVYFILKIRALGL